MTFRPNMTCFTTGIRPRSPLCWRAWDGIVADLWHAEGEADGGGHYLSPDPRVVIFLDRGGDAVRISERPGRFDDRAAGPIAYVPAGMPVWSHIAAAGEFRHLDIHLDARRLRARFGAALAGGTLDRPRLHGADPAIMALAGLIAEDCRAPRHHDLYGEGLVQALLSALFVLPPGAEPVRGGLIRGGLTPRQVRRLEDHAEAHLDQRIGIPDLAAVAGLSDSWFAHAFKQTMGQPPHRWLLGLRVARARRLLSGSALTLAEIAARSGFSDQAHLTRSFRSLTGRTPAVWRRDEAGDPVPARLPPPETVCQGG